jgi:hypothetical protein
MANVLLAMACGVAFATGGACISAALLIVFGLDPAWEVIAWAAICGFVGGFIGGWNPE